MKTKTPDARNERELKMKKNKLMLTWFGELLNLYKGPQGLGFEFCKQNIFWLQFF